MTDRHARALLVAASAALLLLPTQAHAGDGPTHSSAAEAGTAPLRGANGGGIGVPANSAICTDQHMRQFVPSAPGGGGGGNVPAFDSNLGINDPDFWPCSSSDTDLMPPKLGALVKATVGGTSANLINAMGDSVLMACNFTHFKANVMGAGAVIAEKITRAWADEILNDIKVPAKRYRNQHFCNGQTWRKYWRRHMNANHFAQDSVCEHHAPWGNLVCSTKAWFFSRNRGGCLFWLESQIPDMIQRKNGLACDLEVVNPTATLGARLSGQMAAVHAGCLFAQGAACAGLERTMRHHCNINPTAKACAGGVGAGAYCECTDAGYINSAGGVTTPTMQKAIADWEDVCTEPSDPCEPQACQNWCEYSTGLAESAFYGDGLRAHGYCANSDCQGNSPGPGENDDMCEHHDCVCVVASGDDDGCGKENEPCCKEGEADQKCEDEENFACDKETNYCVPCGHTSCAICCPGRPNGCLPFLDAACADEEENDICAGPVCDPGGNFNPTCTDKKPD